MKYLLTILMLLFSSIAVAASNQFGMVTMSSSSVTSSSSQMLPYNYNRCYVLVQNNGAAAIAVKLGSSQSATEGIQIAAGGNWEPPIAPRNSLYAISTNSSSQSATVVEGNCP